jgi:hypothetical protein
VVEHLAQVEHAGERAQQLVERLEVLDLPPQAIELAVAHGPPRIVHREAWRALSATSGKR